MVIFIIQLMQCIIELFIVLYYCIFQYRMRVVLNLFIKRNEESIRRGGIVLLLILALVSWQDI